MPNQEVVGEELRRGKNAIQEVLAVHQHPKIIASLVLLLRCIHLDVYFDAQELVFDLVIDRDKIGELRYPHPRAPSALPAIHIELDDDALHDLHDVRDVLSDHYHDALHEPIEVIVEQQFLQGHFDVLIAAGLQVLLVVADHAREGDADIEQLLYLDAEIPRVVQDQAVELADTPYPEVPPIQHHLLLALTSI